MMIYPAKIGALIKRYGKRRIRRIIPIHSTVDNFYLALVFATDAGMYSFCDAIYGHRVKRDYAAMVQPWPDARPCLGLILLTAGRCGAGLISHEMVHAAGMAIDINLDRKKDEALALKVGHMVSQFYRSYQRV